MKKKITRLLMTLLCCVLLGIIRTAAADGAAAALSEARVEAGETVELTVSISNNPGLAAWMFELEWDPEALELDSDKGLARVGDGFASGTLLSRQRDGGKLTVSWFSFRDVSSDGKLFSFRLRAKASADGAYPVTLSCSAENTINASEREVAVSCTDGNVTVVGKPAAEITSGDSPDGPEHYGTISGGSAYHGVSSGSSGNEDGAEAAPETAEFADVAKDAYYYEAVHWAVKCGVTKGVSADRFDPDGVCSRAQAVTFLWRAAGSPEPALQSCPFGDVKTSSYYYKAVLWAISEGITNGTAPDAFSPDATVDRAQAVTFLWRAEGSPEPTAQANPFTDVKSDAYYYKAVLWAEAKSITKGTTATTFSPGQNCTRGQIVTFLYRAK